MLIAARRAGGEDQRGLRWRAAAGAAADGRLRGSCAPANATIRRRAPRWRSKRRGWPASNCSFSRDPGARPGRGAAVRLHHAQRRAGLGGAAGHVGGRAGDRQPVGGLPEIVRHGENGLLVENEPRSHRRRHPAHCRTIRALPGAWRRTARHTVAERFTVERMVRRTMEVYRQVLS